MNQIPEKGPFSVKSRYGSFKFAIRGLKLFFKTQHNSWIHLVSALLSILLGLILQLSSYEWVLLVMAIGIVLVAECLNTAIEFLVDLISPQFHEQAGKVKDLAAGAVLIASLLAAFIGLVIFLPKLFYILRIFFY